MRYLPIGVALVLLQCTISATIKNTTDFFNKQVGYILNFQTFSGYEDINWYYNNQTASIYYTLYQGANQNWDDHSVPLIIWLQGGPGVPSQYGCYNEMGPLFISGGQKSGGFKVLENPWGWNFAGHLLCVDQPIGTGFSFNRGTMPDNTHTTAKHFANFLYNFLKNSQYDLGKNPLYIVGQSYAGHYIPAYAKQIMTNVSLNFNLKGIALGDGWIDPIRQNSDFDSFLYSVGAISKKWKDTTRFMQNEALTRILKGNFLEASNYTTFIFYDDYIQKNYYNGMDSMNYRIYEGDDDGTNDQYAKFLELNKKQFGVADSVSFNDNNWQLYFNFCADLSISYKPELEYVLNSKIRVLIYNGQNDMVCNSAGVMSVLNNLRWQQAKKWREAEKVQWKEGSKIVGWLKRHENLIFAIVRDAGHLVPTDQPKAAWYMLSKFLRKEW